MNREITCITCPIGCRVTVTGEDADNLVIEGNRCRRGETYAREEILAPKRVVTATAPLKSERLHRISVKTDTPLGKELIPSLLSELYHTEVAPPVRVGDVVMADFRGTGVNVVATRSYDGES